MNNGNRLLTFLDHQRLGSGQLKGHPIDLHAGRGKILRGIGAAGFGAWPARAAGGAGWRVLGECHSPSPKQSGQYREGGRE